MPCNNIERKRERGEKEPSSTSSNPATDTDSSAAILSVTAQYEIPVASVFVSLPSRPPASLENQPLIHPARTGQGRTCKASRNTASIATNPALGSDTAPYMHNLWSLLLLNLSSKTFVLSFFQKLTTSSDCHHPLHISASLHSSTETAYS